MTRSPRRAEAQARSPGLLQPRYFYPRRAAGLMPGERAKEVPLERDSLTRQETHDQATIQHRYNTGRYQVAPASMKPGARQQVRPEPEYPAAGTDVYAAETEQPDQRTAQQNNDRTDGNEPMDSFDNDQGAQDQKGDQVCAQMSKRRVQKR